MLYLELCRITWTKKKVLKNENHSTRVKPRTTSNQSILLTWQPAAGSRTNVPAQHLANNSRRSQALLPSPVAQCTQPSEVTLCGVACEMLFAFHASILVTLRDSMLGAQADDIAVTRYMAFMYSALTLTGRTGDSCLLWGGGGRWQNAMVYRRLLTTATRSNVSVCLSGQVWWRLTYQLFHRWYKSLHSQTI
jgi:hypothetical protein